MASVVSSDKDFPLVTTVTERLDSFSGAVNGMGAEMDMTSLSRCTSSWIVEVVLNAARCLPTVLAVESRI